MSFYQLPDTLHRNIPKIRINVPKDEKARDLMEHLPYLTQMQDPIFQNKVEDLIKNREDLQAYLLATEDLNKTLDDCLKLAVTHGKINDSSKVRHVLERNDPKYQFFKQNDNPLDVLYREHAKFDVQNSIIGSLLQEINKGRLTDENIKNALKGASNTKDLDLEDRWRDIFDRKKPGRLDNVVDSSERPIDTEPPPHVPPSEPPLGYVPRPGAPDDEFIADRRPSEYFFPYAARTERTDPNFKPPVVLDRNLRHVFGDSEQVFNDPYDVQETKEYEDFSNQLDKG